MIQAIIAMPDKKRTQVEALVEHCRKLDGVVPEVIRIPESVDREYMRRNPGANFASLQASGLRYCATKHGKRPFFWMEPDSVPIKAGWLKALNDEYDRQKKPFLISSDSNPPHDLVGGIGFYSADTSWMIPDKYEKAGWDLWMIQNIPQLIGRTPLIQHIYGAYDERGVARARLFPSESSIIRDDALIVHRDKFLGLTGAVPKTTFLHSGDLGDIIASLPVIRHFGGGKLFICDHNPRLLPAMRPMKPRMHLIEPLLRKVPFIADVEFASKEPKADVNFMDFRRVYRSNRTLSESQSDFVGAPVIGLDPWLNVDRSPASKGRIVVCRSPRYHNHKFPWQKIVSAHQKRILFCGLDDEHLDFSRRYGQVEHVKTRTLLDLAELIAGSDMFIGNQSSPCWIAMAMGHPLIQESHATIHDSMVPRRNAQYVVDGKLRKL